MIPGIGISIGADSPFLNLGRRLLWEGLGILQFAAHPFFEGRTAPTSSIIGGFMPYVYPRQGLVGNGSPLLVQV